MSFTHHTFLLTSKKVSVTYIGHEETFWDVDFLFVVQSIQSLSIWSYHSAVDNDGLLLEDPGAFRGEDHANPADVLQVAEASRNLSKYLCEMTDILNNPTSSLVAEHVPECTCTPCS